MTISECLLKQRTLNRSESKDDLAPFTMAVHEGSNLSQNLHDNVIKWKHFPRYWPFVRGIHRSPLDSPHKGQWHAALTFYLISAWTYDWVNIPDAGDLRRHRAYYPVTVMWQIIRRNVIAKPWHVMRPRQSNWLLYRIRWISLLGDLPFSICSRRHLISSCTELKQLQTCW